MPESGHRYKEFNLTQLRVFCEFLQQKSFADTARAMGLSHSAVWQQVRALERRLGVSLLQRHGRTWRPTEDGQALFDLISDLLRSVDSLDDAFRRLRGELPRELRVIATPGSASGELAGPVAEIKRKHPLTRVRLSLGSSLEQTEKELLSGAADLAVVTGSILGRLRRPSLEMILVRQRPAGLLVPPRHPLARRKAPAPTLDDVVAYPLIMPTPDFLWRQRCDDVFRAAGLSDRVQVSVEVSLIQAIEEFVRRKVGVGLTPLVSDWVPGPGVVKLAVGHLFPSDELFLLRRRGKPRPQAQILQDLLVEPGDPIRS
jgi:DNA-binding transcriptional LysR family regulator